MTAWCNGAWVRSDTGVGLVEAASRGIVALFCGEIGQSTSSDAMIAAVVAVVIVAVVAVDTAVALVVAVAVNLSTASRWSTSAADGSSFAVVVKRWSTSAADGSSFAVVVKARRVGSVAVTVGSVTAALMGERGDGILASTFVGNSPLGKMVSSLLFAIDRSTALTVAVEACVFDLCESDFEFCESDFEFCEIDLEWILPVIVEAVGSLASSKLAFRSGASSKKIGSKGSWAWFIRRLAWFIRKPASASVKTTTLRLEQQAAN